MEYVKLLGGLITLLLAGEFLVKGSVGIALKLKISTLVIGMTIVSFGTSAPELLVAIKAALKDKPDIALGAVMGSNVSNIALVLGLTAIVFPVHVNRDTIAIDWPMMMISTLLFYFLILNGVLGMWEGFALFTMLGIFTAWLIRRSRKKEKAKHEALLQDGEIEEADAIQTKSKLMLYAKDFGFIVLGCVGLVYGADWFLDGADDIALNFGISQRVIGLTLVALGTSLPELVTSLVAAFRKEVDISVGNLIGSNIFNLLSILGITSIIKEIPVNEIMLSFDVYWLLAISALILPIMLYGRKVTRLEGVFLVLFYVVYIHFVVAKG